MFRKSISSGLVSYKLNVPILPVIQLYDSQLVIKTAKCSKSTQIKFPDLWLSSELCCKYTEESNYIRCERNILSQKICQLVSQFHHFLFPNLKKERRKYSRLCLQADSNDTSGQARHHYEQAGAATRSGSRPTVVQVWHLPTTFVTLQKQSKKLKALFVFCQLMADTTF